MEELELVVFNIIVHAGNAKGSIYEALDAAKQKDFALAEAKFKEADAEIIEAHHAQTDVIQKEAGGANIRVSVLFVHAQDQLMTTMSERSLVEAMVEMYKKFG